MDWVDTVLYADIDEEIANCYSQIEKLKNRIKILEAKKESENRISELSKQLSTIEEVYYKETTTDGKMRYYGTETGCHEVDI